MRSLTVIRPSLGHGDRAFKGASKQSVSQTIVDVRAATAGAIVFVGAAGDFVSVLLEVRTLFPRIEFAAYDSIEGCHRRRKRRTGTALRSDRV